jgi:hypothetical protein
MKIIDEVDLITNKNEHELSSFHAIFHFVFFIVFFILFLTQTHSFSQNTLAKKVLTLKEKNSLKLIREIEHFGRRELKLKLHNHFYTQWQLVEQPNTYLYVSRADSILLPTGANTFQFFGTDTLAAKLAADSIKNTGLDAMIYRTSGNSAVRLTHQLLNYPEEAIIFIVLHEMAHVHSNQKKLKIPYSAEESFGDFLGNIAGEFFVRKYHPELIADFIKQKETHESLYKLFKNMEINAQGVSKSEKISIYYSAQKQLNSIIVSANKFQHDRFEYPMNHAYILRNRYYYAWYFEYKCLNSKINNLREMTTFYSHFPSNEIELRKLIKSYCSIN